MNVVRRLGAGLTAVLGLVTVLVLVGASSASAEYPPGSTPEVSASASVVTPGGTLTLSGSHFSGTVTFIGHSAPVYLGTAVASGPNGTFTKTVTITAADFPAGDHDIVASDAFGDSSTFGFTVAPVGADTSGNGGSGSGSGGSASGSGGGASGGLAATGVAVLSIGGLGVLMLIGGGVVLMAGKRRKMTT